MVLTRKDRKRKAQDQDSDHDDDQPAPPPPQPPPAKQPKLSLKFKPRATAEVPPPIGEPDDDDDESSDDSDESSGESDKEDPEDEHWYFNCEGCGVEGDDFDDGAHHIRCEGCKTWQHSHCHGLSEEEADLSEFYCSSCGRDGDVTGEEGKDDGEGSGSGESEKSGEEKDEEFPKCENFKVCGTILVGITMVGPNGSRLCGPCGHRFRRSKGGNAWRTSRLSEDKGAKEKVAKEKDEQFPKCENFKVCGTILVGSKGAAGPNRSTQSLKGPNDRRLCKTCGQRFKKSKSGDAWRAPVRLGRKKKGAKETGAKETGTKEKGSKEKGAKETGAKEKGSKAEREKEKWDHTCDDCGRHDGDFSEDGLCQFCSHRRHIGAPARDNPNGVLHEQPAALFSELRDLAHREFRLLHPHDPFQGARPRPQLGPNYWHELEKNLREDLRQRGMKKVIQISKEITNVNKDGFINLLQLDDAWNGMLPRANPSSTSYLHTLRSRELTDLARGAGFQREMGADAALNANTAIAFLLGKRDATDHVKRIKDKAAYIREAVTNVRRGLQGKATAQSIPTHQSHNVGIVGSERALSRLFNTLANGHFPAWTPSDGFQCGPIALARTLQAVREQYNATGGEPIVHQTQQDLRALLFVDWNNSQEVGAQGVPTAAYAQYLEQYLAEMPADLQMDERREMLQLNNMDVQQLIAMVVLLHNTGEIDDFNVGVVTDARGAAPANAQIVRETQDETGAPTIWLHHNHAAGGGEYHHWEGFEPQRDVTDYDIVYEWGLAADPLSNDMARTRSTPKSEKTNESRIAYLTRMVRNATSALNQEMAANGRACKPCRRKDCARHCKRTRGHGYCDPCQDDDEIDEMHECEWPAGSAEASRGTWKKASELTEEDLQPWERALSAGFEQQLMDRTQKYILGAIPKGKKHFLCIPVGRKSSHPGALTMVQLTQSLIMTANSYNNLLNDPNANTKEGQRPAQWMRVEVLAFARHGAMKIPTHHGNLNNDALHVFIDLIDQILDPININNLPVEIHFLMLGIAGFSTDITAWGSRTEGLFRRFLDADAANAAAGNPTNIAGSIYLVPVSELHVYAQGSPSSYNGNNPPHGIQRNNKRLVRYRLMDLIDRRAALVVHAATLNNGQGMPFWQYMQNMLLLHTGNPVQPAFQAGFPTVPQWPAGLPEVEELDRFIMAMYMEMAWRVQWLDANTTPPELHIRSNNDNRNTPMN
ncbi:hypothetical protein LTR10_009775 [Elasticomyces elasticus]|nr:hypothetical protein LTR10_009775 [Elasticomyces elasticus]KAK4970065.1 hypothetical protein LTR42_008232 [Elasticomyces elasticus]